MNSSTRLDPALLEEAAELLTLLQSGGSPTTVIQRITQWRQRSEMHEQAWLCAERVMQSFRQVPREIGRRTLSQLPHTGRRRTLQMLGMAAVAGPLGLALWRLQPWTEWSADFRTATGEQKTFSLADGTRLVLNTASAVNVAFDAKQRQLHLLRGEIMVTTGHDLMHRPFRVTSEEGSISPLGTRYSVRQESGATQVAVFEGAVEITTHNGRQQRLDAGEQVRFNASAIETNRPAQANTALWERGMLLASDMRLADWVAEISRYHRGVLRCSPSVAELRVSGAFPLADTEAALDMLTKTRPVVVRRMTSYWTSLDAPT
jgi:transmembrane sensor